MQKKHTSIYSMLIPYERFQHNFLWDVQHGPIKFNVVYLWLIFCDHSLFSLNGGLKYLKVILYGMGSCPLSRRYCGITFHILLVTLPWSLSFIPSSSRKMQLWSLLIRNEHQKMWCFDFFPHMQGTIYHF